MKPLTIRQVALTNFKNYQHAGFGFGERFNLVHGLNGTGKTNLLDSIYYSCVGKSYFTAMDTKVVYHGAPFFRIDTKVSREENHMVVIKVKPGESKEILLDGIGYERISDHLGFIPVVISAPRDIELITGSGQMRRKYLDHLLCQTDSKYLLALQSYNHLLQLRNATLKQQPSDLRRLIETYNVQMSIHARFIFESREQLQMELVPILQSAYEDLSGGREQISMTYETDLREQSFEILADKHWDSDKNLGRTHSGIHRDEFLFSINQMPAKDFGSQGQIKSVIFAMHLSKYKVLSRHSGFKPVLILDDIFDKLDEGRLKNLVDILMADDFGQVFLSDTDRKRIGSYLSSSWLHEIPMQT